MIYLALFIYIYIYQKLIWRGVNRFLEPLCLFCSFIIHLYTWIHHPPSYLSIYPSLPGAWERGTMSGSGLLLCCGAVELFPCLCSCCRRLLKAQYRHYVCRVHVKENVFFFFFFFWIYCLMIIIVPIWLFPFAFHMKHAYLLPDNPVTIRQAMDCFIELAPH